MIAAEHHSQKRSNHPKTKKWTVEIIEKL